MLDLDNISIRGYSAENPSVGLSIKDGQLCLCLPIGLAAPEKVSTNYRAEGLALFSLLYRVFKRFHHSVSKWDYSKTSYSHSDSSENREGMTGTESVFYDPYNFTTLFERIDISHLLRKNIIASRTQFDADALFKFLGRATFDKNGGAYLERYPSFTALRRTGFSGLAGLYLFLAKDFFTAMGIDYSHAWGPYTPLADQLIQEFESKYHTQNFSLFDTKETDSATSARNFFRGLFDKLSKLEPCSSQESILLSEEIRRYLYHSFGANNCNDGHVFGVSHFWPVWEALCIDPYLINADRRENIETCDVENLINSYRLSNNAVSDWKKQRETIFNNNQIERRPDLCLKPGADSHPCAISFGDGNSTASKSDRYRVVDFKYKEAPNNRPKVGATDKYKNIREYDSAIRAADDFNRIEVYGLLLERHLYGECKVQLEFWFPAVHSQIEGPKVYEYEAWDPPLYAIFIDTKRALNAYAPNQLQGNQSHV